MGNGCVGPRRKSEWSPGCNARPPRLLLPSGEGRQVSVLEDEGGITRVPSLQRRHAPPELEREPVGTQHRICQVASGTWREIRGWTAKKDKKSFCFDLTIAQYNNDKASITLSLSWLPCSFGGDSKSLTTSTKAVWKAKLQQERLSNHNPISQFYR